MKLTDGQINAACEWWCSVLCKPKFDNGDDSFAGGFGVALQMMAVRPISENQLKIFSETLTDWLRIHNPKWISCDYHPCTILAEAVKAADISFNNIPIKTDMYFLEKDGVSVVEVSYGYASSDIEIYREVDNAD